MAELLTTSTRNFWLVRHKGIAIDTPEGKKVYHLDNIQVNECGGNLLIDTEEDFLQGRTLYRRQKIGVSPEQLSAYYRKNCDQQYNLLRNNCEHFTSEIITGKPKSRQLQGLILGTLVISGFFLFNRTSNG